MTTPPTPSRVDYTFTVTPFDWSQTDAHMGHSRNMRVTEITITIDHRRGRPRTRTELHGRWILNDGSLSRRHFAVMRYTDHPVRADEACDAAPVIARELANSIRSEPAAIALTSEGAQHS